MPHNTQWQVYKRGALVLLPVLGATLYFGRGCIALALRSDARDEQRKEAELQWRVEEERRKAAEQAQIEAQMRARAKQEPRPTAASRTVTIAGGQAGPDAIAADATHVYWLNESSGDVLRAKRAGGAPEVIASKQALDLPRHAQAIAVDGSSVYWITSGTRENKRTDGSVMKAPKAGGEASALATGQVRPTSLALDGSEVFWVTSADGEESTGGKPANGAVMKVKKAGGKPAVVASAEEPCGLAVDKTHVYFIAQSPQAALLKAPKSGGPPVEIASSSGPLGCSVAVDESGVYWISRADDAVMQASKFGDAPTPLLFQPSRLTALAVDKAYVYSIAEGVPRALDDSGSVYRTAKDGSSRPTPLSTEERGVNGVTIEGGEVFWTRWSEDSAEGAVVRLPK